MSDVKTKALSLFLLKLGEDIKVLKTAGLTLSSVPLLQKKMCSARAELTLRQGHAT